MPPEAPDGPLFLRFAHHLAHRLERQLDLANVVALVPEHVLGEQNWVVAMVLLRFHESSRAPSALGSATFGIKCLRRFLQ